MSQWKVSLECIEGGARKFWRARIVDNTLYVNYGRIGTDGQTQVKEMPSVEACEKELGSLERSKRKKGYLDGDGGDAGEGESASATAPSSRKTASPSSPREAAPAMAPADATSAEATAALAATEERALVLVTPERRVSLRLVREGDSLRIEAREAHANPLAAAAAFSRLFAAFRDEGYKDDAS